MNAPFFLVHGDDPPPGLEGGGEVDVGHLRQGVPHSIVNRPFADFSAFNMGDGNPQRQRDRSGSEHFVAVGNQKKNVRPHLPETIREAQRGHANGLGHADVGIRAQQTFDARSNWKSVVLNFPHRVAELGREVRPQDDQLQIHLGMHGKIAQRPVEVTVVCAGGGDDGDFAFQVFLRPATDSKARAMFRSAGIRERACRVHRAERPGCAR